MTRQAAVAVARGQVGSYRSTRMRGRMGVSFVLGAALVAGCAPRAGVAYVEIENDQSGTAGKAEPVLVDPRVDVVANEYRRSFAHDGSAIKQRVVIRGPVMIVPAPGAGVPTTQSTR